MKLCLRLTKVFYYSSQKHFRSYLDDKRNQAEFNIIKELTSSV